MLAGTLATHQAYLLCKKVVLVVHMNAIYDDIFTRKQHTFTIHLPVFLKIEKISPKKEKYYDVVEKYEERFIYWGGTKMSVGKTFI